MCDEIPEANEQLKTLSYEEKVANCSVIAKPMASQKLASRCYKLIKKAYKLNKKENIFMGTKAVQAKLRKGLQGIVMLGGDVTPVEILCHFPAVCEEKDIPYIFLPSKTDMAAAIGKCGLILVCILVKKPEYADLYEKVETSIKKSLDSLPII